MRLVSYEHRGRATFGVVIGDGITDASDMVGTTSLRRALETTSTAALSILESGAADVPLEAVRLLPPVPYPEKVICVGLNYHAHIAEIGLRIEQTSPLLFTRFANSQVGHDQPLIAPSVSECFDYEGELAVVIGRRARHVAVEDAYDVVLGYSCFNEGTIRDWQGHSSQVTAGKNFPASGAFGPWVTTADEVPDPGSLRLQTRLNGEVVQDGELSDLVFDIPQLIHYCSTFTELVPGDVIVTGTTAGVGAFRKPPLWMKPGDTVEIDIPGVGLLRNPVLAE